MVAWSFGVAITHTDPAVAGIIDHVENNRAMFPLKPDSNMGVSSWTWPQLPIIREKHVDVNMFNATINEPFVKRGAHNYAFDGIRGPSVRRQADSTR